MQDDERVDASYCCIPCTFDPIGECFYVVLVRCWPPRAALSFFLGQLNEATSTIQCYIQRSANAE